MKWYQSKTIWTGIGGVVTGAGLIAMGNIPEGVQTIIVSLLGIFGRTAIAKTAQQ